MNGLLKDTTKTYIEDDKLVLTDIYVTDKNREELVNSFITEIKSLASQELNIGLKYIDVLEKSISFESYRSDAEDYTWLCKKAIFTTPDAAYSIIVEDDEVGGLYNYEIIKITNIY